MAEGQAETARYEEWRQGDVALDVPWFVQVEPGEPGGEPYEVVETGVRGLVALTQTCDIVRDASARPFVEFAPLVEIPDPTMFADIERGGRPNYAIVPALRPQRLVADLDRAMTLHKDVVATWERTPGWTTDDEVRSFAQAPAAKGWDGWLKEWLALLQAGGRFVFVEGAVLGLEAISAEEYLKADALDLDYLSGP